MPRCEVRHLDRSSGNDARALFPPGIMRALTMLGMLATIPVQTACRLDDGAMAAADPDVAITEPGTAFNPGLIAQGKQIFRFDTFGDETFWTDTLGLHEVIRDEVSPLDA